MRKTTEDAFSQLVRKHSCDEFGYEDLPRPDADYQAMSDHELTAFKASGGVVLSSQKNHAKSGLVSGCTSSTNGERPEAEAQEFVIDETWEENADRVAWEAIESCRINCNSVGTVELQDDNDGSAELRIKP